MREGQLASELLRARHLRQTKAPLAACKDALHEQSDLTLCQAAERALTVLDQEADAPPERALPRLESTALTLTRLSTRLRYLSLAELSQKRLSKGDAGAPPLTSASSGRSPPQTAKLPALPKDSARAFELSDSPVSQLMTATFQLERDVLRNIGAYLEYAELPVRRSAFASVKRLRSEHPEWPLLDHLLHEAWLLESDGELKSELREFSGDAKNLGHHSPESK